MTIRLGFLGTGNMGAALAKGISGREDLELIGFDPDQDRLQAVCRETSMQAAPNGEEVARSADCLIVAVKPHLLETVVAPLAEIAPSGSCLLSIAAGVSMSTLRRVWRTDSPVVRTMPNTPSLYGRGVFALCLDDPRLTAKQAALFQDIFTALGAVYTLPESQFDAFTALIGSGPAYVFAFMEALVEAGVSLGLARNQTTEMVNHLLGGATHMAGQSSLHVSQLREMVSSPGGTTLAGLNHFDRQAFRGLVIDAVRAAHDRSRELGQQED